MSGRDSVATFGRAVQRRTDGSTPGIVPLAWCDVDRDGPNAKRRVGGGIATSETGERGVVEHDDRCATTSFYNSLVPRDN